MKPCPRWSDNLPAVLVFGLVWIGSSIPADSMPDTQLFDYDKLLHFGEYTVVGLSLWWLVRRSTRIPDGLNRFFFVLALGMLWGMVDELHQGFSGRDSSLWDLLADSIGLITISTIAARGWLDWLLTFGVGPDGESVRNP